MKISIIVLGLFIIGCTSTLNPDGTQKQNPGDKAAAGAVDLSKNPAAQETASAFPFGAAILGIIGIAGAAFQTYRKNQADQQTAAAQTTLTNVVNQPAVASVLASQTTALHPDTVQAIKEAQA